MSVVGWFAWCLNSSCTSAASGSKVTGWWDQKDEPEGKQWGVYSCIVIYRCQRASQPDIVCVHPDTAAWSHLCKLPNSIVVQSWPLLALIIDTIDSTLMWHLYSQIRYLEWHTTQQLSTCALPTCTDLPVLWCLMQAYHSGAWIAWECFWCTCHWPCKVHSYYYLHHKAHECSWFMHEPWTS